MALIFPRLFFRAENVTGAEIGFRGYAEYAPKYEELARVLGRPRSKPREDELHLIRRLSRPDRLAPAR